MFGRIEVAKDDVPGWTKLGPDPVVDGIDVARLAKILARRKRTVKETLLDQKVLAGIGNIQAIESLWRAKIDPRTRADALRPADVRALAKAIHWSIDRTLEVEHAEEITYVEEDRSANPFMVYGKRGKPCPRCKTGLERIVLGGRGTYLCPGCQRRIGKGR
jgi:formamidopyrimidine-DNA glycosylase